MPSSVPRPGHAPSAELAEAIRESVRSRLARHECPREIEFVDALPLTTTGKIMRRELRQRVRRRGPRSNLGKSLAARSCGRARRRGISPMVTHG